MASPSKEENILRLILENSPLRHWHFGEFVKEAKITKAAANKWLKKYCKEGLIKKIKEKGKFSYFTVGSNNLIYQNKKRICALEQIYKSGIVENLINLKNAKTVILFGSMAKGDWYDDSDVDLFIYGSAEGLEKPKYELKLKRKIELHVFETKRDINKVKTGLISNIINGYIIKGRIQDIVKIS